jgi:hypothetical protein
MSDIRQGVTETQNAVLDMLEAKGAEWGDRHDVQDQIRMAGARAKNALYAADNLVKQREYAIEAAARLIDAIGEMDRELASDAALKPLMSLGECVMAASDLRITVGGETLPYSEGWRIARSINPDDPTTSALLWFKEKSA